MEKSDTFQFRICVIGDHGVGKTQIIYRYVEDRFEASYIVKGYDESNITVSMFSRRCF